MITIDGSQGEGGGQILRTALALAIVTQTPVHLKKIRAKRDKPGLRRQHLMAVRAAAQISGAKTSGDAIGSRELRFEPRPAQPGDYTFDIGSAGSATLVLQTILPPLLVAAGRSTIELIGGTHNPFAPPFDFLDLAFLPLINRMGPRVERTLERPGFYPAGGGRMRVEIEPVGQLAPIELLQRGEVRRRLCRVVVSNLPEHIAQRELATVAAALDWPEECLEARRYQGNYGPGNVVTLEIESEHVTEVFTGFGRRGVAAETVAAGAAAEAQRYLAAGAPVGEHLADQLLLPLALAGGGQYVATRPSTHVATNVETIRKFLDVPIRAEELPGVKEQAEQRWRIMVG